MSHSEIELKFLVPSSARAAVAQELARAAVERITLAAKYLDTPDRRLAKEGIAWRLRREGRRWVQTLKAPGSGALERFEHEVTRPAATCDASEHANTAAGDRLLAILRAAATDGVEVGVRYETRVRRTTRRIRTRGAVVEIALDEGKLSASGASVTIREIEFELVSGSTTAMLALAERWRHKFGLVFDPRSKSERGDRLAQGSPYPPVRKASLPDYPRASTPFTAFGVVLDECLGQITRNAIGLIEGDPASRIEHVHQLRVGIRRLRSGLQSFRDLTPVPPAPLVDELKSLFETLGRSRDSDVLEGGVVAELNKVGAPPLTVPAGSETTDPVKAVSASAAQANLLAWLAWRVALEQASNSEEDATDFATRQAASVDGVRPLSLARTAQRRVRRWHRRIVGQLDAFDQLDEPSLHALRKLIKRQRYAVEFFAPLLRRHGTRRYMEALSGLQSRMGELNDLFVARARYEALVATEPAAWFAVGWLVARIVDSRGLAKPALERLSGVEPPTARR